MRCSARALSTLVAAGVGCAMLPALASAQGYTKQSFDLSVKLGPGHAQTCVIAADIYKPDGASASHRVPAVLATNGFGGSKADQAVWAVELAARGYAVLSYSGLGFGGSSCRIALDSTQWDGEAASDLVTFLGGGLRATDGTRIDYVKKQTRASNGRRYTYDPVVGMVGGSYGGEIQFAAAAQDPRIDTIVPVITWNELTYSLAPNNATLAGGGLHPSIPGITKRNFLLGLWFIGTGATATTPTTPSACSNFLQVLCGEEQQMIGDGYASARTFAQTRVNSVASYISRIRVPVMLMQGEDDNLFNLQESVATYASLRAAHTPVKLVWQSWGHSHGTAAPGELASTGAYFEPDGAPTLEGTMILDWFNHYLKHTGPAPALNFSYFRPWVSYAGDDVAKAYASAPAYPLAGSRTKLYLSAAASSAGDGSGTLSSGRAVTGGTRTFTVPQAGGTESDTGSSPFTSGSLTPVDPAGSFAAFESAPLRAAVNIVGVPTVTVKISAPRSELASAIPGTVGLFFRLEDIAPSGVATLPDNLVSPARFVDGSTVTVQLPGIVHRFAKGDRIALVIAGSDEDYALPDPGATVSVVTSAHAPGVLSLPVS